MPLHHIDMVKEVAQAGSGNQGIARGGEGDQGETTLVAGAGLVVTTSPKIKVSTKILTIFMTHGIVVSFLSKPFS